MFKIPADMKFFKETTTGNVVVMGSNTLKSFPGGKPLKDRLNIVLYPDGEDRDDCRIVRSVDELFRRNQEIPARKSFRNRRADDVQNAFAVLRRGARYQS